MVGLKPLFFWASMPAAEWKQDSRRKREPPGRSQRRAFSRRAKASSSERYMNSQLLKTRSALTFSKSIAAASPQKYDIFVFFWFVCLFVSRKFFIGSTTRRLRARFASSPVNRLEINVQIQQCEQRISLSKSESCQELQELFFVVSVWNFKVIQDERNIQRIIEQNCDQVEEVVKEMNGCE